MADYWKSQPKKFCQYCKCWIADNKPSVEFHERGKNHKENVAAKISEIKKKSMDKLKQDEKNCKEFAAMEAAAMKAYEEDLKRMQLESGTAEVPTASPSPPPSQPKSQPKSQSQPQSQPKSQPQRREKKGKRWENDGSAVSRTQSPVWLQGKSEDGHMYYYNTQTGESKWENPEGFQGESSDSTQTGQSENSTGGGWKDAVSPEGHTYYYNTATGETRWERPADFSADASGPGPQDESQSQPEPPGTSSPAPAAQEPEGNGQDGQQPKGPKISFRKRKADTESTEKEEDGHSDSGDEKEDEEEEEKEQEEASNEEAMKTEEEEEKPMEGEVKEEQEGAHAKREEVERKAKKPRKTTPYGAWEQIQEEEDPYDNVDLQLPQMEGMEGLPSGLDELPPEPKPKFRERTITSLGDEGGPASFKKSRALNGRARSIRQRVEDD